MRKYRILSVLIILVCVFVSSNILMIIFDKLPEVNSAQENLKDYKERMSDPVDALDPVTAASTRLVTGELIIPKLEVDCWIRTDTVNAYDSVYHYPQSAAYGQPGECGILGHRTTYSGIFSRIGELEPGDQVIIKDLTLKKEYIYQVTSNGGDIRWDYKTNPVKFSLEGERRLLLTTCYPPGEKSAVYITHCKLVSTRSY
jgi:sortase A